MLSAIKYFLRMASKRPVVVVLGSTGTGKSDLAIEIAQRFGGEIISADAMQVYRGLDIVTNKVNKEQTDLVPHHLIGYADPLSHYTVVDFRNKALPIIKRIQESGKIPIIVGGTNYYIESLLFEVLVSDEIRDSTDDSCLSDNGEPSDTDIANNHKVSNAATQSQNEHLDHASEATPIDQCADKEIPVYRAHSQADIDLVPSEVLYHHLSEVDPVMAGNLHPNNRRKVLRSLQVYEQLGRPHSQILAEQKSLKGGSSLGGPLRFPDVCLLWIRCEQSELNKRLDDRVDAMLTAGLLQELSDFHRDYNEYRLLNDCDSESNYTKGIFQSIGFKEFHSYLVLSENDRASAGGQKLLEEGIAMMKIATRRYARKQTKWIVNRFLRCADRQMPPVYGLDAIFSDPSSRNVTVTEPALAIVKDLLKCKVPTQVPLSLETSSNIDKLSVRKCEICDCYLQGHKQWHVHVMSRKHKKLARKEWKNGTNCESNRSALKDVCEAQAGSQDSNRLA